MMIKSFKGLLADEGQERINLSTNDGRKGYRITKFELMGNAPGTVRTEHIVKVYKTEQAAVDGIINFSDQTLLAAGIFTNQTDANDAYSLVTAFDNEIFNQDIFVTSFDQGTQNKPVNWYLELEQIDLSLNEQTVATLQNIRDIGV
jgi:hypothetical protein